MGEWSRYAVRDFIPFTRDAYLRMLEQVSAAYGPLSLFMLAAVLILVALTLTGRRHWAGLLLASLWGWVGYSFLPQFYAPLNWAGHWFAIAFYVQALLLAVIMGSVRDTFTAPAPLHGLGWMLCVAGLAWPLLTRIGRNGWSQVEVMGIHPDPTAVLTLGLGLLVLSGWRLWVITAIPLFWCLLSGLTLGVLDLPQAKMLYGVVGIGLGAMVYGTIADRMK